MQTTRLLLAALTSAFASLLLTPAVFAQGALTPPGAPAPMFKTLDQIEARKPLGTPNVVTTSTIVISEPGSYVLVGPITVSSGDGITINANNVTVDLNGFTITSTAASGNDSGIKINGDGTNVANIAISNGNIFGAYTVEGGVGSGTGFYNGIYGNPYTNSNISIKQVRVRGARDTGIYLNPKSGVSINTCHVSHVGSIGVNGELVTDCIVNEIATSGSGIVAINVDKCGVNNPLGYAGIIAKLVSNSSASGGSIGIDATSAINSYGLGAFGINASSLVTNSTGRATSGSGTRYGIYCPEGTVSFSNGFAVNSGANFSILAKIAIGCTIDGVTSAPISSPQKHLGTP